MFAVALNVLTTAIRFVKQQACAMGLEQTGSATAWPLATPIAKLLYHVKRSAIALLGMGFASFPQAQTVLAGRNYASHLAIAPTSMAGASLPTMLTALAAQVARTTAHVIRVARPNACLPATASNVCRTAMRTALNPTSVIRKASAGCRKAE
jgi:hypothetical protein